MKYYLIIIVFVLFFFRHTWGEMPIALNNENLIYDDFLVNEDPSRGIYQYNPAIAMDSSGNYIIVWEDYRNDNVDIYFQYYNSLGEKIGTNQKVNNSNGMYYHRSPRAAMDANGNFIIVWLDNREGDFRIYFQQYNSDAEKIGMNQMVEMDTYGELIGEEDFALRNNGEFIIVWRDYRSGDKGIYFQRYDKSANPLGNNQLVSLKAGNPAIAVDTAGEFIITWEDTDENSIFFKRYHSNGEELCEKTIVDSSHFKYSSYPHIAMYNNGNYIISWSDDRNEENDIYIQMYDSLGYALGENILVNNSIDSLYQGRSKIGIQPNGNFIVTWMERKDNDFGINFQRFNVSGEKMNSSRSAVDDTTGASQGIPDIAVDSEGNFLIVWQDDRNDMDDIFYQRFDSSASAIGINQQAEDDQGASSQEVPSLAVNKEGEFVISWFQRFGADNYIYSQKYNQDGTPFGNNIHVNNTSQIGIVIQPHPAATAMNDQGKYVVAWESDAEPHRDDIMFQLYDYDGTPIGENQAANGDDIVFDNFYPQAVMREDGNFIITWLSIPNDLKKYEICFQRFDGNGNRIGDIQLVNDEPDDVQPFYSSICMTDNGDFIISWTEEQEDYRFNDIKFQIYDSSAAAVGNIQKVLINDDIECRPSYPQIACNNDGRFTIVWHDNRNGDYDIFYQIYDKTGTPIGENQKANDNSNNHNQLNPSLTMDSAGNLFFAWNDYRFGEENPDIIGQKAAADGTLLGNNVRLVEPGPNFGEKNPILSSNDNGIFLTWQDNRRSKGWDIYAKAFTWDWTGLTGIKNNKPNDSKNEILLQNYPNPFHNNTNIAICSNTNRQAQLEIYDLLGRKIWEKNLFLISNQNMIIKLSTKEWPVGIYFYKLKSAAGQEIIKKGLLLR